ncbi:unnamed protein product [Ranitomeya imitator]|uniref:Plectin/eS10 N-terminal domain-containing protein n=1 Tax=Ranitomeya imitator TaxID=111125 RepID=A0ABN9LVV2_9NEOB|nr:unnamed protein product [Ranitomeya imitator]
MLFPFLIRPPRKQQRASSSSWTSTDLYVDAKKDRIAIYELLFKEGVMVAKKDVHMPKHPELSDKNVPNLHVMKAMQSLKSRGYVKEQFAWRHFYWYLTNEGIQYLRDFLHLPPEIVPATLRRSRPETGRPRPKGLEGERPARLSRGETDRDTYRRSAAPPGADKKAEAGAGAATEFQFYRSQIWVLPLCSHNPELNLGDLTSDLLCMRLVRILHVVTDRRDDERDQGSGAGSSPPGLLILNDISWILGVVVRLQKKCRADQMLPDGIT